MWTPVFIAAPKTTIGPYHAHYGYHQSRDLRKNENPPPSICEALEVCRSHKWTGYIDWRSSFGVETDSCQFIQHALEPAYRDEK